RDWRQHLGCGDGWLSEHHGAGWLHSRLTHRPLIFWPRVQRTGFAQTGLRVRASQQTPPPTQFSAESASASVIRPRYADEWRQTNGGRRIKRRAKDTNFTNWQ